MSGGKDVRHRFPLIIENGTAIRPLEYASSAAFSPQRDMDGTDGTAEGSLGASATQAASASRRHASVLVEPTRAFYSHTLRCRESNIRQALHPVGMPSISDLLYLAVTETDFVSDLDPATLEANCATSIDLAALLWEERHDDIPVPLSLIQWARCALLLEAEAMLRDREAHAEAERLDAITAGDIDAATGCFIPYDTYRGA